MEGNERGTSKRTNTVPRKAMYNKRLENKNKKKEKVEKIDKIAQWNNKRDVSLVLIKVPA